MVPRAVNPPNKGISLTITPRLWDDLTAHHFPGDHDEHGSVILAEQVSGPRGTRLLARQVIVAMDGIDHVPGEHGYRALTATFVRDNILVARANSYIYLAVHNHRGDDRVGFSHDDLASHERGYPALSQISGLTVGGLVITPNAAAGDLWLPDGTRTTLAELVIPGNNLRRLRSRIAPAPTNIDDTYERQARLFGDKGQNTLALMTVAIVGLGGIGSILVELLARLGVGHLILIDNETVDETNLPRLIAAEPTDVDELKTEIAARNAVRANPKIKLTLHEARVEHPAVLTDLAHSDWIFVAADTDSARHWVNATIQRHLIPGTQAGVKIPVTKEGTIGRIHAVTRLLTPGDGCLWCNELIDPTELAIEMQPDHERAQARYVDEVPAASVIALNSIAAAEAVGQFMLAVTNLHTQDRDTADVLHLPRDRNRTLHNHRRDPDCQWCR
jgi:molybdopterin/thiamine biosynthesis adenylyltransferase